ncbi:MAG: alkene reductase [Thalassobius sp.]|nr:alkene reductase [Thalassovita sp.]
MKLFSEYKLGNLTLQNRIVMAPMTRSRAIDNLPNDLIAEYYGQRSSAGLIITEGTAPSANGLGYARIPGLFTDEQIEGWKKVTAAAHKNGAKIFVQMMHTGRASHPDNMSEGTEIVAPSSIALSGEMYTDTKGPQAHPAPKEMTKADIDQAIQEFVTASKNAIEAGFDGVEVHAANGYLIEQFINTASNKRTDEYGGSVENRTRFVLEVTEAIANAIGADKTGIRVSPYGVFNDMEVYEELDATYEYLTKKLSDLKLAYIHVVDHSSMGAPAVPQEIKDKIRDLFKGTYILSGGYDLERAEKELEEGKGELVAFGRAFVANPDLVERFKQKAELNQPDFGTFYTPGEKGFTDYAFLA